MENKYKFRNKLLEIHTPNIRDYSRTPSTNEFSIYEGINVLISKTACEVIRTAVLDCTDFLKVSMGISSNVDECHITNSC